MQLKLDHMGEQSAMISEGTYSVFHILSPKVICIYHYIPKENPFVVFNMFSINFELGKLEFKI